MSELSDYADTQVLPREHRDPYVRGQREMFAAVLKKIKRLLPAHNAEIREQAMLEQMEADCKAVCPRCRDTEMPAADFQPRAWWSTDNWGHGISGGCVAGKIRAAWAEAHPKVK